MLVHSFSLTALTAALGKLADAEQAVKEQNAAIGKFLADAKVTEEGLDAAISAAQASVKDIADEELKLDGNQEQIEARINVARLDYDAEIDKAQKEVDAAKGVLKDDLAKIEAATSAVDALNKAKENEKITEDAKDDELKIAGIRLGNDELAFDGTELKVGDLVIATVNEETGKLELAEGITLEDGKYTFKTEGSAGAAAVPAVIEFDLSSFTDKNEVIFTIDGKSNTTGVDVTNSSTTSVEIDNVTYTLTWDSSTSKVTLTQPSGSEAPVTEASATAGGDKVVADIKESGSESGAGTPAEVLGSLTEAQLDALLDSINAYLDAEADVEAKQAVLDNALNEEKGGIAGVEQEADSVTGKVSLNFGENENATTYNTAVEALNVLLEKKADFELALGKWQSLKDLQVKLAEMNSVLKELKEAVDTAEKAITDEEDGLGVALKTFGTDNASDKDDVFLFADKSNETVTITNFGNEGFDSIYFAKDYTLVALEEGQTINDRVGNASELEIFWQQKGDDLYLYVEADPVAGNAKNDEEITTIKLTGVAFDDITDSLENNYITAGTSEIA